MRVLIAYEPQLGYTKFHRDRGCPGILSAETNHDIEYLSHDLEDLPETVKPCQFECCFQGYSTAAELKSRVHDTPKPTLTRGLRVGQMVTFRELGKTGEQQRTIVDNRANAAAGGLAKDTPIARALLGREVGEVVDVQRPKDVVRLEILEIC